jgi:hypothetical protein
VQGLAQRVALASDWTISDLQPGDILQTQIVVLRLTERVVQTTSKLRVPGQGQPCRPRRLAEYQHHSPACFWFEKRVRS